MKPPHSLEQYPEQILRPTARRGLSPNQIALLMGLALCLLWTWWAGKDLNWDLINYHYYLPFELLRGRIHTDFFPAGAQSYLNPLPYIPLYLMDRAGFPSLVTFSVLASFQ